MQSTPFFTVNLFYLFFRQARWPALLVIILIIFGAGKLPEIGAGLGKGIKNFKKATIEEESDPEKSKDQEKIEDKKDS
jgi:sec-independent protein translocase protein TatA